MKFTIKPLHAILFLSIFFAVGTVGMLWKPEMFQSLTPMHLCLTAMLLLAFAPYRSPDFIRFVILVFVAGFAVEVAGVKTGKIFGAYQYGYALGQKLAGVPLIIGVNWVIMVLCSMAMADLINISDMGKSLLGAAMMTGLDFLIEQMAPVYHFWYFDRLEVPLRNYVAWFVLGFFFQYLGRQIGVNTFNPLARPVFVMLSLFFLILSVVNFFI